MTKKKPASFVEYASYSAFWKERGDSVIDHLQKSGVDTSKMRAFYNQFGDVQLAFLEKLIVERVKEYDQMDKKSPMELAFLGHDLLAQFMKRIDKESREADLGVEYDNEMAKLDKMEEEANKNKDE